MNSTALALLALDVLNVLSFSALAILGLVRNISYPFPAWFRDGTDICFYAGILLFMVGLPLLASSRSRFVAALSAVLSFLTVAVIAVLTAHG